jgi:hypothetical protein
LHHEERRYGSVVSVEMRRIRQFEPRRGVVHSLLSAKDIYGDSLVKWCCGGSLLFVPIVVWSNTHVEQPPLAIDFILTHKRVQGGTYKFSVKYVNRVLAPEPVWLSERDARTLSPEITTAYKTLHNI